MKLINKKTGEIIREAEITVRTRCPENDEGDTLAYDEHDEYTSLAKLNAEWEDYEPKEPLIKDEKIRKAVRAWAEANGDVNEVIYKYDTNKVYCELVDTESEAKIRFNFIFIYGLSTCQLYTIDELCREEEE